MKVRVYRVEHEELPMCGPFRTGVTDAIFTPSYHTPKNGFPVPHQDGIPCNWHHTFDRVCGCRNMRQLLRWFPSWAIRQLRNSKYGIAVYEIDKEQIMYGRNQVVFPPSKAERILFK